MTSMQPRARSPVAGFNKKIKSQKHKTQIEKPITKIRFAG